MRYDHSDVDRLSHPPVVGFGRRPTSAPTCGVIRKAVLAIVSSCPIVFATSARLPVDPIVAPTVAPSPRLVFARPAVIRFGATVAEMQAVLKGICATMRTRRIDPPFLPNVADRQMQIDCDGFPFLGKPRWAEFVIGDDSLEMVWIMMGPGEDDAILNVMTAAYGPPTRRNQKYDAFTRARAALRHDRHEVLFYSDKLAPAMEPDFTEPGPPSGP